MWTFVDICNYMFPVLHAEIGLVNNILTAFYEWLDERVEPISTEEQLKRNRRILAWLAFQRSRTVYDKFQAEEMIQCNDYKLERVEIKKRLRILKWN